MLGLVDRLAGLAVEAGLHRAGDLLALLLRLADALVEAVDVAHAHLGHLAVAVLHLAHGPFERDHRLLRVGDDGGEEMRDAVVDGKLQHLGVDHDQAAFLRGHAVEDRQDHGVDRHRLAGAGGAGDEQMRELGDVGDDRLAVDGLAERERELRLGLLEVAAGQQLAQIDRLAPCIGQLDADGVAPRHHGDAAGDGAHRAGDVVGEADDAAGLDAGRGLQLVERDHRAGPHMDDLALDAEILQHTLEQARVLLQRLLRQRRIAHHVLGLGKEVQRRQLELGRADQRALRLAPDARALKRPWRRRLDAGRGIGAEVAHLRGGCMFRRRADDDVVLVVVIVPGGHAPGMGTLDLEGWLVVEVGRGLAEARLDAGARASARADRDARRGEIIVLVVPFVVAARHGGELAAREGLGGQPPMRRRADGRHHEAVAILALVLVVEIVLLDRACLPAARRGCGELVRDRAAAEKGRGEGEQPQRRHGEDGGREDGGGARGIAARKPGRDRQHDIADHAAEPGGQRPRLGRGDAADHAGGECCPAEPGAGARRDAVDPACRDEAQRPGHGRDQRHHGAEAEELHQQVGHHRAGIAHGVGDDIVGGVAEGRVGDVPRPEAGEAERRRREGGEPRRPRRLPPHEAAQAVAGFADRQLRRRARTHVNTPSSLARAPAPARTFATEIKEAMVKAALTMQPSERRRRPPLRTGASSKGSTQGLGRTTTTRGGGA